MNELISTNKPGDYILCNDQSIQIKTVVEIFFKHYGIPMSRLVDRKIKGNRAMNQFNAKNNKIKSSKYLHSFLQNQKTTKLLSKS